MKSALSAIIVSAALLSPAWAERTQVLPCPDDRLDEVRRHQPVPGLFTALMPPLGILNLLSRDSLAKLPTRPVAFRVTDEVGRPVPNALVGLIHRQTNRFLAEGAAGGAPIRLPHGKYTVNAAIADKDRAVRYGSAEVSVAASGPATVTVKLSGKAGAATTKPAPEGVPVGTAVTLEVESSLRGSAVLTVVRRGANVRTMPDADSEAILAQTAIEDGATQMLLPGKAGKYDIVAMLCAPRVPLARWSLVATPARVAIAAPDRAPTGSTLQATISGALNAAYRVKFGEIDSVFSTTESLTAGERQDVRFKVPYDAGKYLITVITHDDVVLARRPVAIEAGQFTISGPDTISLGAASPFDWPNRDDSNLQLEVWTLPRNGKPARRISTVADKRVVAPLGDHELRLVRASAIEKPVVARKPLRVEGQAFEQVPTEVTAGSRVTAKMAIDVEFFDKLYFFRRGSDSERELSLNHSRDPRLMTADAPKKPGSYDLVFLMGAVGASVEVARVPIEVRAP